MQLPTSQAKQDLGGLACPRGTYPICLTHTTVPALTTHSAAQAAPTWGILEESCPLHSPNVPEATWASTLPSIHRRSLLAHAPSSAGPPAAALSRGLSTLPTGIDWGRLPEWRPAVSQTGALPWGQSTELGGGQNHVCYGNWSWAGTEDLRKSGGVLRRHPGS